jgi:AcrR family transcriptional regulator
MAGTDTRRRATRGTRRDAIVEAAVRVAGRKGYRAMTVAQTIAEAGVARTTFYKHFADKHECFLAAHDLAAKRALAAVEAVCAEGQPWLERVRSGLASLVELLAADPQLARVVAVEAMAAGAEGRRRQLALLERCAQLLEADPEAGSNGASSGRDLPETTGGMAAGGVAGLLFDEIQAGRAAELRRRMPDLLFALLTPYVGPRRAAQEAQSAERYAASR